MYNTGHHDLLCKNDPSKPRALEDGFKSWSHVHRAMNEYHDLDRRTYVKTLWTTVTTVKKGKGSRRKKKTIVVKKVKSCSKNVRPLLSGYKRPGVRQGRILPQPSDRVDHMVFRCPEPECEFCLSVHGRTGDGGYDVL